MTLADFTSPGLIIPQLDGRDVPSVIQELSHALQREARVPDLLPFYHSALNREFLVGTDWEQGMALPHARLPGLKELSFAFGRAGEPITWGSRAACSIRFVFLIAIPASDSVQYLSLISGLARLSRETILVEQLRAAQDTFQILAVLQQIAVRGRQDAGAPRRGA